MLHNARSRLTLAFLLTLILALLTVAVVGAGPPDKLPKKEASVSVAGLDFLGMTTFATGVQFGGTEVGGLSSLTYDSARDVYYIIADDASAIDPARFYTAAIDLGDGALNDGDVTFLDVTTLLDENGQPFAPGSLDPEGIILWRKGSLFVSSEGITAATPPIDPFIWRYNLNGRQTAELPVPHKFLPRDGAQGVRQNLAFESLTVTPDGRHLFTAAEGALAQDGPAADVGQETLARFIQYDARQRRALHEYVYVADAVAQTPVPPDAFRVSGIVEILALDNQGTFLVMERSFSVGAGNTVTLFEARIGDATDVSGIDDLYDESSGAPVSFEPMEKRFLLDFAALGLVPDNIEGMTLGPVLPDGSRTLLIVSDNNFAPSQVTQFIALGLQLDIAD